MTKHSTDSLSSQNPKFSLILFVCEDVVVEQIAL